MAALCWRRQAELTDSLVDLFITLVQTINTRAVNKVNKTVEAEIRRVLGREGILFKVAEAAVEHPDATVREAVYPAVDGGEQTLRALVAEATANKNAMKAKVCTVLESSYSNYYQRMLPQVLSSMDFRCNNTAYRPVIDALNLLRRYTDRPKEPYDPAEVIPIDGVVPADWREAIYNKHGKIIRTSYELWRNLSDVHEEVLLGMAVAGFARTRDYRAVFDRLVLSHEEYCLILRGSSKAREVVVPYARSDGARGSLFARDVAMEQVVATAARQALNFASYAMIGKGRWLAPAGPVSLRTPDQDWNLAERSLIRRAHTIALLLAPEPLPTAGQPISPRTATQLEQIIACGFQARVIVVLPPYDRCSPLIQRSVHYQACVIVTLLQGGGRIVGGLLHNLDHYQVMECQERVPATALLVKVKENGGEECSVTQPETPGGSAALGRDRGIKRRVVATGTYIPGLHDAINLTERELYELSFQARYP